MSVLTAKYSLCKVRTKLEGNISGNRLQYESILWRSLTRSIFSKSKLNNTLILNADAEAAGVLQPYLLMKSEVLLAG